LLSLSTNKLLVTAAYKYVALAVMLTNCNLFVQQTHLPLDHQLTQTNIVLSGCSVAPPRLMGFGGSIVTRKYFFGFRPRPPCQFLAMGISTGLIIGRHKRAT